MSSNIKIIFILFIYVLVLFSFSTLWILRTFREHHILVIIATNLTQSTIGGIVKNINNLNKGILKMPNEIILVNIIVILSTFIFLVLVGVI